MIPKVSLVMPTYNRGGSYLQDAIKSVLNQSFRDFELIIVDDASTDKTKEVVLSFKDARIVYEQTGHNHGEYWSTNFGMSLSKGAYVSWIHSDDMLPPDSIKNRIKELFENARLDFVHGDIQKIDKDANIIETIEASLFHSKDVFNQYINHLKEGTMIYLIHHTTIMMKRSFFYKAGPFDSSLPFAGDIDWMVRALRIGTFKRVPHVLYLYRTHGGSRRIVDVNTGIDKISVHKNIANRYL